MPEKFKIYRGVIAAAIIFFGVELAIVLLRYHAYYHTDTSFDLGIFNQVFWNGLQGRFFQNSLSSTLSVSVETPFVSYHRLGQHFTPVLLLWLPIYALFPYAPTLLFLNVTLITVAGNCPVSSSASTSRSDTSHLDYCELLLRQCGDRPDFRAFSRFLSISPIYFRAISSPRKASLVVVRDSGRPNFGDTRRSGCRRVQYWILFNFK